jgi:hypothetical protein
MRQNLNNSTREKTKPAYKAVLFTALAFSVYLFFTPQTYGGKVYVPKGTEISVKYKLNLTTEMAPKPYGGEIFEVASKQVISGIEVFQAGGEVFCEITKFKKPGLLGGGGEIEIRIDSVKTTLGKNIAVESQILKSKGKNNRLKAILMVPILGYGFLVKGEHAELGKPNETIILKTAELNSITF